MQMRRFGWMLTTWAVALVGAIASSAIDRATASGDGLPQLLDVSELGLVMNVGPTGAPSIAVISTATDSSAGFLDLDRLELIDMAPIDGDLTLRADGAHAWRTTSPATFEEVELATGAVTGSHTVPWTTDWTLGGIGVSDPTGRYVALDASSGLYAAERAFVFDTATGTLVTPDPQGVGLGNQHRIRSISAGAEIVEYVEWEWLGEQSRAVRWNRTTGERTDLGPSDPTQRVSPDGAWSLSLVGDAWVRREGSSGTTSVVPVPAHGVHEIRVFDGGRVIVAHLGATDADANARQLSAWDGTGPLQLLSRAANGDPASFGIAVFGPAFAANTDASRIAFVSASANLDPSVPGGPATFNRLFVSLLPPATDASWPEPGAPAGKVQPGETYCVPAIGADPGDLIAVNVTPVRAERRGYGTVHSSDDEAGNTSNVNFHAGSVDPNLTFVEVGSDGEVCFTNSEDGSVDVVIDELLVAEGSLFMLPTPAGADRTADTRFTLGGPRLLPGERRCVESNGQPGDQVAVNVTPIRSESRGYGTLHSSDDDAGDSSTVNFDVGSVDPNLAIVQVGADGRICFTNSPDTAVDLILDELAVAGAGSFSLPTPDGAARLADTRRGLGGPVLAPGETRCFAAVGAAPDEWVGLNATPVRALRRGFGTLHSSDDPAGATSNVNFAAGTVDPNLAIVRVGADGRVCFTNSADGPVDLVLDQQVNAAADTFAPPTPAGAHRLTDTRSARH